MYIAEVRRTVLPPVSEADRCASAVAILQRGCLSNKSKVVMPDFCSAAGCSCQRNAQTKEKGITFHRYVFFFFFFPHCAARLDTAAGRASLWRISPLDLSLDCKDRPRF